MNELIIFLQQFGGIIGLAGLAPLVVMHLLNRKGANQKMELDEDASETNIFSAQVSSFEKQTLIFEKLLKASTEAADAANESARLAREEMRIVTEERRQLYKAVEEQNNKIEKLRTLFRQYVFRAGIDMTPEELEIFEQTKPSRLWQTGPTPTNKQQE